MHLNKVVFVPVYMQGRDVCWVLIVESNQTQVDVTRLFVLHILGTGDIQ